MAKKQPEKELIVVGQPQKEEATPLPAPVLPIMTYEAWWLITQRRLDLKAGLKDALKKHMRARGFLASGRFDDGLRDFGIES